jgi:2-methylcitrate dehydratase PrpD
MSGRDFLTAAVAGYEIGPRVGMCMGQEHIVQGWHSGATVGVFSAAAGSAAAAASARREGGPCASGLRELRPRV